MSAERFSKYIKSEREQQGTTQPEIAKKYGVSLSTVRNWENGQTVPSIDHALRIAEVLGVDIQDIVDATTDREPVDLTPVIGRIEDFRAETFGAFIKEQRELAETGMADVASEAGTSVTTLQAWENGKRLPNLLQMIELADTFDMTVADLVEGGIQ